VAVAFGIATLEDVCDLFRVAVEEPE